MRADRTDKRNEDERARLGALTPEQRLFQEAADSTPAPLWMTNSSGAVVFVNRAFQEHAGLPAEALMGDVWQSLVHSDDLAGVAQKRAAAWADNYAPYKFEARFRRADGAWRLMEVSSRPRRGPGGVFAGYVGLAIDITDQRRAAEALSESERRYRELVDGLDDAIVWEGDLKTFRFTFVSGAAERLLGYAASRWTDEPSFWADHIHPDDRAWALQYCNQETAAGRNHEFEYRMIAADGRTVWLRDKVYISAAGEGGGLSRGIMIDITEAKRRDEALRAREAELELVARMTPLALTRCDKNLVYSFVNRAAAELLGLPPEQIVGRPAPEVFGARAFAVIRPYIQRALRGEMVEYEAEIPYPGAGPRWVHVNYTPDRNLDGEVAGYFASVVDITERKKAEEHKKLLIDELNHRVRNTLSVVQSIARQTFKDDGASEAARRAFEGRLLALGRAHGLLTRTNWESAAMADIVREAILTSIPTPGRVSAGGPDVPLEPKSALAMAMALHELFTNALKYGSLSNETGRIEISWRLIDDNWFELRWVESGGLPVALPTRRGYGSVMIEGALARDLGGAAAIEYRPEGVRCTIAAPYAAGRT